MILCGGKGTRLGDVTKITPKPMVTIGNDPIVWHIMHWYAQFGCRRFILCLGYLKSVFQAYFKKHAKAIERLGWEIELVDTGADTATGGRVWQAANKALRECETDFFLTYGDGVSDVDILKLLKKHQRARRPLTISAVHPASRFGELVIKGDRVTDFYEKGIAKYYINGGFMVVNKSFITEFLTDEPSLIFEQKPMHDAAASGQMTVYKHEGFWQCMDTPREFDKLNQLWRDGAAPWATRRTK